MGILPRQRVIPGIVEAGDVHHGPLRGHELAAWDCNVLLMFGFWKIAFCSAEQNPAISVTAGRSPITSAAAWSA